MNRSIVMLVIGAIAGAAAALVYTSGTGDGNPTLPAASPSPPPASTRDRPLGVFEAELSRLPAIAAPLTRRATALALAERTAYEFDSIATIASSLPSSEALNFTLDALAARAERDPAEAIQAASTLEYGAQREQAITRIARVLTRQNPQSALTRIASFGDDGLAAAYLSGVLGTWAESDPDGVLAYLEGADLSLLTAESEALTVLAEVAPERLLAASDRFPARLQRTARLAAFEAIAKRDVELALTLVESAPVDPLRADAAVEIVAQVYARQDLAGAVAWTGTLSDSKRRLALSGIASVDTLTAINFRLDELEGLRPTDTQLLTTNFDGLLTGPSGPQFAEIARVLDRLNTITGASDPLLLRTIVDQWINQDTESALTWMIASPDRLPEDLVTSAAIEIAGMGSDRATQTLERVPPDQREQWMSGLAMGMAASDFRGALDWVAQYQGQPGYDAAVTSMLTGATGLLNQMSRIRGESEPHGSAIAEFLNDSEPALRARYGRVAATEWAMQDPAAAADWALNLDIEPGEEQVRIDAVGAVAGQWAAVDSVAARTWALRLRAGATRDAAIGRVLLSQAGNGTVDDRLLNALSSATARQQVLLTSMTAIGQNDPELGRTLIDTYFVDPALREQAEQALVMGTTIQPAGSTLTVR